ncbi:MAG: sigma-54-dependent Fis family transcriptional regulator [Nitrospinota bacterium]|nr:MAG: sigma-54-dependent Fis family transcriptional regulator [Nitrospinota bacterium]
MTPKIVVLIVDDEETFRKVLSKELAFMGYEVIAVPGGEEACQVVRRREIDVVLLDIKMPGMGGVETLKRLRELSPLTEVIMLTGHGTIDDAVQSMKLGAYDYLTKPCKLDELESVILKAWEKRNLVRQNVALRQELTRREQFPYLIGQSPQLKAIGEMIEKVAPTDSTVLIQGESGVGKELIARCIHRSSNRRDQPFIVVDCGSLHEHLLQSELFGHEKGAFTGAITLKHGLFEVADQGTLFLDEIGEISPAIQVQLLRVLETGTFRRVGGTKDLAVNVRIIAATNRNLAQLMQEGKFREDLYFRLNVISITVPPLRERVEDIPPLIEHFLENMPIPSRRKKRVSSEAMAMLCAYPWPGNVRELKNVLERAVILSEGEEITPHDLPSNLHGEGDFVVEGPAGYLSLEEIEKQYIARLLREFSGHRAKVASILKISERNLYRKIKKYNL